MPRSVLDWIKHSTRVKGRLLLAKRISYILLYPTRFISQGQGVEQVRMIRDEIEKRVHNLVQLDWASLQDIVETSDPEPTVSVGIEQQAMLAGRIGSAVLS